MLHPRSQAGKVFQVRRKLRNGLCISQFIHYLWLWKEQFQWGGDETTLDVIQGKNIRK